MNEIVKAIELYRSGVCSKTDVFVVIIRNIMDFKVLNEIDLLGPGFHEDFRRWGEAFAFKEGANVLASGIGFQLTGDEIEGFRRWLTENRPSKVV